MRSAPGRWLTALLFGAVVAAGLAVVWLLTPPRRLPLASRTAPVPQSPAVEFHREQVGAPLEPTAAVRVTDVQVVDFDDDGRNDLLVCDGGSDRILTYSRDGQGNWREHVLADDVPVPAHATLVDLDGDGDRDVVVAVLGTLDPSDYLVGQVLLLLNDGGTYQRRVLLSDLRRVADVQPGDFDGDGDTDLAVAVFGYLRGEVLWLENRGRLRFRDHQLLFRPGAIHVPVGDYDGDGDPDIATITTRYEEELWGFENQGGGRFQRRRLYYTSNYDVGGGLVRCDLDRDGDLDLLLPQGNHLENPFGRPQPYHGCKWMENRGNWDFLPHQIAYLGETSAAAAGDIDGDGDLDVALVSMSRPAKDPEQPSVVWLENDGKQNFTAWRIDDLPANLATVACGDLDGDGRADVVAGCLKLSPHADPTARRLTCWFSRKRAP